MIKRNGKPHFEAKPTTVVAGFSHTSDLRADKYLSLGKNVTFSMATSHENNDGAPTSAQMLAKQPYFGPVADTVELLYDFGELPYGPYYLMGQITVDLQGSGDKFDYAKEWSFQLKPIEGVLHIMQQLKLQHWLTSTRYSRILFAVGFYLTKNVKDLEFYFKFRCAWKTYSSYAFTIQCQAFTTTAEVKAIADLGLSALFNSEEVLDPEVRQGIPVMVNSE